MVTLSPCIGENLHKVKQGMLLTLGVQILSVAFIFVNIYMSMDLGVFQRNPDFNIWKFQLKCEGLIILKLLNMHICFDRNLLKL